MTKEIQQDTRTIEQIIDDMSLFDDDLMSMVFITQTDIFGYGIPIYTVNRRFEEIDGVFDDGSHIIYVNGAYKADDAIGNLIHDFGCISPEDMYYQELANGIRHFKDQEGGRKVMCEAVENYAKSYAETVRLNGLLEAVKNLMANMKLGAEQAMNLLGVNESDREILLKRL